MRGSDGPVALLTADYAGILATMREALEQLDPADEEQAFRSNAEAFHRVEA